MVQAIHVLAEQDVHFTWPDVAFVAVIAAALVAMVWALTR
jgi:hypothetical protein